MPDKLTIATPISVRVTEGETDRIGRAADFYGMNKSEYIRHLIERDYAVLKKKWAALSPLFADESDDASATSSDKVGHSQ